MSRNGRADLRTLRLVDDLFHFVEADKMMDCVILLNLSLHCLVHFILSFSDGMNNIILLDICLRVSLPKKVDLTTCVGKFYSQNIRLKYCHESYLSQ